MIVCACSTLLALAALLAPGRADEPSLEQRARTHWAFQPVRRPDVPVVRDRDWVRTPIDAFILAKLEKADLKPAAPALCRTLLRRVYFGFIGLPPTPEEQAAFLADDSPDALARVVDRLLASPQYGERWGRHWLDVARYADTNGYERDGDKPFAWRYRDYVISALNADHPFDRFVREQIAGDELPNSDARMQIATTFLRLGSWDDEPANDVVDRYDQLDDVLGATSAAFLAQTIRCARCHDHKFEPISQKEYYGLLAVFAPLRRPQRGRTDLPLPVGSKSERAAYEQTRQALGALTREMDGINARIRERVFADSNNWPEELRLALRTPISRRSAQQNLLIGRNQGRFNKAARAVTTDKERGKLAELTRRHAEMSRKKMPELPQAYIWAEDSPKAPVTRLFRRGNPNLVGPVIELGLPAVLAPRSLDKPKALSKSTGRRSWLADWIASPKNPLTARVIVNRLWQWHFGTGIVSTANDFGLAGEPPSHPELLDWLAYELVRSDWSLKHIHRLIVLSNTYQTSSAHDGPAAERKLALFGRWRQRRLEAEVVRDSMLAISGRLNREQFGPGVYPPLPQAVLATQSRPGLGWGKATQAEASRRSVYIFSKRTLVPPELELLDAPDSTSSCEQRPISTTAPQALTFLNGAFTNEQVAHFADRLIREVGDDPKLQVRRAFVLALCRPPSRDEEERVLAFLEKQARQIMKDEKTPSPPTPLPRSGGEGGKTKAPSPPPPLPQTTGGEGSKRLALASFCLVLFNTSEFFYPG